MADAKTLRDHQGRQKKPTLPPGTIPAQIACPVWLPEGANKWILQCPQCKSRDIFVHNATLESGNAELGTPGRVYLHCNGHKLGTCHHFFIVIIQFSDGSVQSYVTTDYARPQA